jgi:dihydroxy-acid dehydratase
MTKGMRKGLTSYGDADFSLFLRKAFIKAMGLSDDALARPVVGIANTFSDYNACHGNVPKLVEAIKRGVMLAGALPMEFPTISIHESFAHPTSMFLRNLMAMDTEEMIRAQPMDAVVLIGGCDKTIPAQMMACASADVPAIIVPVGPMLVGHYNGEQLGACTDCRRLWGEYRGGRIDAPTIERINERLAPTPGTCMVMGTASTMACIVEAMGLALPRSASIPATHADRLRSAEASGQFAAAMAVNGAPKPSEVMTPAAFRNAMVVLQAIGGSTNGLVHLTAAAGRLGIKIDLAEFDKLGREVPVLLDLKPSGAHYMEHFHWAGGVPRLLRELGGLIDLDAPTVLGGTLRDYVNAAEEVPGQDVIRTRANPIKPMGSMAVLHGNLAPRGAVIKQSARGGVRVGAGHDRAHRRPGPRRERRRCTGAAQRRPGRRARHAGSRLPADPQEARATRCEGHGSHFRCAHERHRVRNHRAAHHAGVGGRRPAGPRAKRRHDLARRAGAPDRAAS